MRHRHYLNLWAHGYGLLGLVILGLNLSGCMMSSNVKPMDRETHIVVPSHWSQLATHSQSSDLSVPIDHSPSDQTSLLMAPWLSFLNNSEMMSYIQEALDENFDLKLAVMRLAQASTQITVAESDLYPSVDGGVGAQRRRLNTASFGQTVASYQNQYSADLSISWEVDVWGRLANRTRASVLNWQGAQADLDAARLSLITNVARGWFALLAAQKQKELTDKQIQSLQQELEVIEEQYRLGVIDALPVLRARTEIAREAANQKDRELEVSHAQQDLEVLLGRYPSTQIVANGELTVDTHPIDAGVPADLLVNRPDIVSAKKQLNETSELAAAAHKERFPRFSLTSQGGYISDQFKSLLQSRFFVWSILGNLTTPIIDHGQLKAQASNAQKEVEIAEVNYQQLILFAFQEVERGLKNDVTLQRQVDLFSEAVKQALTSEKLALEQYHRGLTDYTAVLDAQRQAFEAQRSEIRVRHDLIENRINLYLALGGPVFTTDNTSY